MSGNRTGHNTGLMPIGILSAGGVRSTALDRYIDKGFERENRRTMFNLVSRGMRVESERVLRIDAGAGRGACKLAKKFDCCVMRKWIGAPGMVGRHCQA